MKSKIYQNSIDSYFNEIYIENELATVTKTIELFNKLIEDDTIPFDEYIDIINFLYDVQITDNDLLKISSFILGGPAKSTILKTTITKEITTYFDQPKSLEVEVKVAFTDEQEIDLNYKYSANELIEMIDRRKIILLDFVIEEELTYNKEITFYELYPLNNITSNNFINIKKINLPEIIIFLKKYFTVDKLKRDLTYYTTITEQKLEHIENYLNSLQAKYLEKSNKLAQITKQCKKIKERKMSKET